MRKQMINVVQMVPPSELAWKNESLSQADKPWSLRSVMINQSQIISVVPCDEMVFLMSKGRLPTGLHEAQQFSKISFTNGKEIIVVGSPESVQQKVKKVLHG